MSGKAGMHRRLLHPARAEEVREKIRATLIIKRLEDHVLEEKEMSASQVTAALGLLRKAVPDLAATESRVSVEHSGAIEHRGLPEISGRVADLLSARADRNSKALLPH